MNKSIKKVLLGGLIGLNIAFGMTNFVSADTGVMDRLEKLVVRMEKASANMPVHFNKSTLVNVSDVKLAKDAGYYKITGTITNATGADIDSIYITFNVYDAAGNTLDSLASTVVNNVKNGKNSKFDISVFKEGCAKVEIKEVSVKVENIN